MILRYARPARLRTRSTQKGRHELPRWPVSADRRCAPDASLGPPEIHLGFAGDATRVQANASITAELQDENGIWIAGTSPESTIRLAFDDGTPIDVTSEYHANDGSDIMGSLSYLLPPLGPGWHHATLFATDNLGNPASARLEFEIIEAPIVTVTGLMASPNPTRQGANVTFVLDVAAEVELRLFRVDGREVYRTRQHHDGLRRGLVSWNGRAADGRPAANGVYLYTLDVRPNGSPAQEFSGKLVVLH